MENTHRTHKNIENLTIRGARQHNLKNISVVLPKNKLVVVTGPSGSGKSSLAFDTIYAEGQRRYVESLSAYARQFLGMQDKPEVDEIVGLSPAISIEQKGTSHNPRSTVGTVTEIYDYLRLLYGRAGTPHCPQCGKEVLRYSVDEIVGRVLRDYADMPVEILSPLVRGKKGEYKNLLVNLRKQGYLRARIDGAVYWLEEEVDLSKQKRHTIEAVIDRLSATEENRTRLSEAIEMALKLSGGFVLVVSKDMPDLEMTEKYICPDCEISLPEIEPRLFSFNNPFGACPDCSGLGVHLHFSKELAVNDSVSIADGALIPWRTFNYMLDRVAVLAKRHGWDLTVPFRDLPPEAQQVILYGTDERVPSTFVMDRATGASADYMARYEGLLPWLARRYEESDSEQRQEELAQFRSEDVCATCGGRRLKPEALAVTVGGYNIAELTEFPIFELARALDELELSEQQRRIIDQALSEVRGRLEFLVDVGAGYLSLSRRADSLSGGESQRIRLATQIGSKLTGVLYVLDEPTIGLHPRDTNRLLDTLKAIRDIGNTVLVVEHDRDTMKQSDHILELGPGAGELGGYVVAEGPPEVLDAAKSLTGAYLRGEESGVYAPARRRKASRQITLKGCAEHNLKNADFKIPLGVFAAITGVSGSGKSTLLYEILYKGLRSLLDRDFRQRPGAYKSLAGYESVRNVVLVDQSPIGRTPRSNPATYTGVFTPMREFFAELPEAKLRGYTPGRFSFNVKGGRCEACKGEGTSRVSMLFLPDVYVKCDVCGGQRYNRETLEVKYRGFSISDVLRMTVDEAVGHFRDIPRIANKLQVIQEAGLGYIRLGQSATTLSGGEAQRVKLATELSKRFRGSVLYLMDEPTTGLHYTDVKKLLVLLHKLVDQGNSVLTIEHNLDVLASADWLLDLGPEGGPGGGRLVAQGTPEDFRKIALNGANGKGPHSYTADYMRDYLEELR